MRAGLNWKLVEATVAFGFAIAGLGARQLTARAAATKARLIKLMPPGSNERSLRIRQRKSNACARLNSAPFNAP